MVIKKEKYTLFIFEVMALFLLFIFSSYGHKILYSINFLAIVNIYKYK